ncbi:hypothetical protein PIB30_105637, partial [Stylosanthes scabra]|nr:hypothetical protein [Stylosanthes scabra]
KALKICILQNLVGIDSELHRVDSRGLYLLYKRVFMHQESTLKPLESIPKLDRGQSILSEPQRIDSRPSKSTLLSLSFILKK